ncbi:hypothetical protein [Burkholderia stabilis]|uniref:Uncharacterized protein n=1 Tax=Burkholderia stabilis TaxID=95485 RepID=A0A1Y1BM76_9BURK|nr:hypothetical protein [Burkholderia stabilis]BAX58647.1 hypothetical protein BSFP_014640 [Burkholderia stabilis]
MHFSQSEFDALSEAAIGITDSLDINPVKAGRESISPHNIESTIEPFSWTCKQVRTKELRDAGWRRPKGAAPITYAEPDRWVDMETGELFTKHQVRDHGIDVTPSPSLRTIHTQSVIQPLSDEKRLFIFYILGLRNTRGGLIVDLETAINRWISWAYPNIDITDRSRKRLSLENWLYKYGILATKQTFKTDFQIIAHSKKKDYIAEESLYFKKNPVLGKPGYGFAVDPLTERKKLVEWIKSKQAASSSNRKK